MMSFQILNDETERAVQKLRQATEDMKQTEGNAYLEASRQACEAAGRLVTLSKEMNDLIKNLGVR